MDDAKRERRELRMQRLNCPQFRKDLKREPVGIMNVKVKARPTARAASYYPYQINNQWWLATGRDKHPLRSLPLLP